MEPTPETMLEALLASPIAALGTLHEGAPFVSMVPVVPAPGGSGFLIHVSRLAQHTRDLVADARMSLLFTAPLTEDQDPLALPRVTLQGAAEAIAADSGGVRTGGQGLSGPVPPGGADPWPGGLLLFPPPASPRTARPGLRPSPQPRCRPDPGRPAPGTMTGSRYIA
ncbi:MAG: pyridoxamine 5'-phosphate oxidase family protein [Holophagaceae bacterium]|nr:pyridoxamine 5'-phosphate oxidase family protein [Holophagaceae bacterium]